MSADKPITNADDVIDSRDVIERIAFLRSSWEDATGDVESDYVLSGDDWKAGLDDDEAEELVALLELQSGAEYVADWEYGATLVRESHFEDYARELAEDIGAIDKDAGWPLGYIDWEAAADALLIDYTSVDFDGITYYVR